jgi:hypothetical protein
MHDKACVWFSMVLKGRLNMEFISVMHTGFCLSIGLDNCKKEPQCYLMSFQNGGFGKLKVPFSYVLKNQYVV